MWNKVFTLGDYLFFGSFNIISLVVAIIVTLTPENTNLVGITLMWGVVIAFLSITIAYYFLKRNWMKDIKFVDRHGITVVWSINDINVDKLSFQVIVEDLITKFESKYYGTRGALSGCVVYFREPTWQFTMPGYLDRKVAGLQDGMLIYVGWNEDLRKTALAHELAHRILQVCANDPDEETGHKIMTSMGI